MMEHAVHNDCLGGIAVSIHKVIFLYQHVQSFFRNIQVAMFFISIN